MMTSYDGRPGAIASTASNFESPAEALERIIERSWRRALLYCACTAPGYPEWPLEIERLSDPHEVELQKRSLERRAAIDTRVTLRRSKNRGAAPRFRANWPPRDPVVEMRRAHIDPLIRRTREVLPNADVRLRRLR